MKRLSWARLICLSTSCIPEKRALITIRWLEIVDVRIDTHSIFMCMYLDVCSAILWLSPRMWRGPDIASAFSWCSCLWLTLFQVCLHIPPDSYVTWNIHEYRYIRIFTSCTNVIHYSLFINTYIYIYSLAYTHVQSSASVDAYTLI